MRFIKPQKRLKRIFQLLSIVLVFLLLETSEAQIFEFNLIRNQNLQISSVNRYEAFLIATGRKNRDETGKKIEFIMFPLLSEEHRRFCNEILETSVSQFNTTRKFCEETGRCSAATIIQSEKEMLKVVSETPGAIGYVENYQLSYVDRGVVRVTILY